MQWSKSFDQADANQPELTRVAMDAAGNVAAAGYFFGTANFGGAPLVSAGAYDVFVAKLGSNGQHLWSKRYGDASGQGPHGLGFDGAGNLFVAGTSKGAMNLGAAPLTTAGFLDMAFARLDSSGNHVWSRQAADAQSQSSQAIAFDSAGYVLITGALFGSADFGNGTITSAGSTDLFIGKLAP